MNKIAYARIPKLAVRYRYVWSNCTNGHAHTPRVYPYKHWPVGGEASCGDCIQAQRGIHGYVTAISITETYDPCSE